MNPFAYYADETNAGDLTLDGFGKANTKKLRKLVEQVYGPEVANGLTDEGIVKAVGIHEQPAPAKSVRPLNSYEARAAELNPDGYGGNRADQMYQNHLDKMQNLDNQTASQVSAYEALANSKMLDPRTQASLDSRYDAAMSGGLRRVNPMTADMPQNGNSPVSAFGSPDDMQPGSTGWAMGGDGKPHFFEIPRTGPGSEGLARVAAAKAQRAKNEALRKMPGFGDMSPEEKAAAGYVNTSDFSLMAKNITGDPAKFAAYKERIDAKRAEGRGARRFAVAQKKLQEVNPFLGDMEQAIVLAKQYNIPVDKAVDYMAAINQQKIAAKGQVDAAGVQSEGRQKPSMTVPEKFAAMSTFESMTPTQKKVAAGADPEIARLYKDWVKQNPHLAEISDDAWDKLKKEDGNGIDPSKAFISLGGGFGSPPTVSDFSPDTRAAVSALEAKQRIYVPALGKHLTKEEVLSQWDSMQSQIEKKKAEAAEKQKKNAQAEAARREAGRRTNPYGKFGFSDYQAGAGP